MSDNQPTASICIPTKNASPYIENLLKTLVTQEDVSFEIIIVDSGSIDGTPEKIREFVHTYTKAQSAGSIAAPVITLYQINQKDFGHGKTRNLMASYAKGKYIAFLSQDALPVDSTWLKALVANFSDPLIAGVYSRQIAPKNVPVYERYWIGMNYPETKVRVRPVGSAVGDIFFSNVSSCLRKDLLIKYPFDANIIMSEDQAWAKTVIDKGYLTTYEPLSKVIHGHSYSFMQTIRRYFDSAYSLQQILGPLFRQFSKSGAGYMTKECIYILKNEPLCIVKLSIHNIAKITGTFLGLHASYLPLKAKRFFSMHSYYWK